MIICPSCKSEQMIGTLFCMECGTDLQTPSAPTLDLPQDVPNIPVAPPPPSAVPRTVRAQAATVKPVMPPSRPVQAPYADMPLPGVTPPVPPRRSQPQPAVAPRLSLRLMILNSGRVVELSSAQETIIIGRVDLQTGDQPDVDLTQDNGQELGVSRRHARITFKDNHPYITDLGSANKTFLNRQALTRGEQYQLQDGDEVRLGNVIMKIILSSDSSYR